MRFDRFFVSFSAPRKSLWPKSQSDLWLSSPRQSIPFAFVVWVLCAPAFAAAPHQAANVVVDGDTVANGESRVYGPATSVTLRNVGIRAGGVATLKTFGTASLGTGFRVEAGGTFRIQVVPDTATAQPTYLAATADAHMTQISLSWTDNSGIEMGFKIERKSGGGNFVQIAILASDTTTYLDQGLLVGTTYTYRVRAYGGDGDSGYTNEASATTIANRAPMADPITIATLEDTPKAFTLTGSDLDGNTITYHRVTEPLHGKISGMAPNLSYSPDKDYNGPDSFTFKVNDGISDSNVATVSISVTSINDPPLLGGGPSCAPNPVWGLTATLQVNATDDGGESNLSYSWSKVSGPSLSAGGIQPNGSNAAKSATVSFAAPGNYIFQVVVTDNENPPLSASDSVAVTVQTALASLVVSPANATVNLNGSQLFQAQGRDQFQQPLNPLPALSWSVTGGGSMDIASGQFTAGGAVSQVGEFSVRAQAEGPEGQVTGTANLKVQNATPAIDLSAAALPNPVQGTATQLSVLGADDGGESALTYAWSLVSGDPAKIEPLTGPWTNATKNYEVRFRAPGTFGFRATVTDPLGASATSDLQVTVKQAAVEMSLAPLTIALAHGGQQLFAVSGKDQFGVVFTPSQVSWSVLPASAGSISSQGLFTAGTGDGLCSVKATSGSATASAVVLVGPNSPPKFTVTASVAPNPVFGDSTQLSARGEDDGSSENLTYTWSAIQVPAAGSVVFTPNGNGAAKEALATFSGATGDYVLQVTVTDRFGGASTSSTVVTVKPVPSSLTIAPPNAVVALGGQQQFSATGQDQFGHTTSLAAAGLAWTVSGGGSMQPTGLFTAGPVAARNLLVTAACGDLTETADLTVQNQGPQITAGPTAVIEPLASKSATLSVAATDAETPAAGLLYRWSVMAGAPGPVAFSVNGTAQASNVTATFVRAGTYLLRVEILDEAGAVTAAEVTLTVPTLLKGLVLDPDNVVVPTGGQLQFKATGKDQFGQDFAPTGLAWTVSPAAGTIDPASGLFIAGQTAGTNLEVTVSSPIPEPGITSTGLISIEAAPSIAITSPPNDYKFYGTRSWTGMNVSTTSTASAGSVRKVELFLDNRKTGESAGASTTFFIPTPSSGAHTLLARLTSLSGLSIDSAPITFTVCQLPVVSIVLPTNNSEIISGQNFSISVLASDPDGQVASVALLRNGTQVASLPGHTGNTYNFVRNEQGTGTISFSAQATDSYGGITTSPTISVKHKKGQYQWSAISVPYKAHTINEARKVGLVENFRNVWLWSAGNTELLGQPTTYVPVRIVSMTNHSAPMMAGSASGLWVWSGSQFIYRRSFKGPNEQIPDTERWYMVKDPYQMNESGVVVGICDYIGPTGEVSRGYIYYPANDTFVTYVRDPSSLWWTTDDAIWSINNSGQAVTNGIRNGSRWPMIQSGGTWRYFEGSPSLSGCRVRRLRDDGLLSGLTASNEGFLAREDGTFLPGGADKFAGNFAITQNQYSAADLNTGMVIRLPGAYGHVDCNSRLDHVDFAYSTVYLRNDHLTCNLTAPANAATYWQGETIRLEAIAASSMSGDFGIDRVEFYSDTQAAPLGQDGSSPFTLSLNNLPIRTHNLTARAYDRGGAYKDSDSVPITVGADTTPLRVHPPADMIVEATSSAGAVVSFPSDLIVDDHAPNSCTFTFNPVSGSGFPNGSSVVTVSARDQANLTGTTSFIVTVVDRTPPVLTLPSDITATATSSQGATVNYGNASATDNTGCSLTYSHPNSSIFPHGITVVGVKAQDSFGNASFGTFKVTVLPSTDFPAPVAPVPDLPPVISLLAPADGFVSKGTTVLCQGNVTNDDGYANIQIQLLVDGLQRGLVSPDPSGNFNLPLAILEGKHLIKAVAYEDPLRTSSTGLVRVWIDRTAPADFLLDPDSDFNSAYSSRSAIWGIGSTPLGNCFTSPGWLNGEVRDIPGPANSGVTPAPTGVSLVTVVNLGMVAGLGGSNSRQEWLAPVASLSTGATKGISRRLFPGERNYSFSVTDAAGNLFSGDIGSRGFQTPVILDPGAASGRIALQLGDDILVNMWPGTGSWATQDGNENLGAVSCGYSHCSRADGTYYRGDDKNLIDRAGQYPKYDLLRLKYSDLGIDMPLEFEFFSTEGRPLTRSGSSEGADASIRVTVFEIGMRVAKPDGFELTTIQKVTPGLDLKVDAGDDDADGLPNNRDADGLLPSNPTLAKLTVNRPSVGGGIPFPSDAQLSLQVYAPGAQNGFGSVRLWYDPNSTAEPAPGTRLVPYQGQPIDLNRIHATLGKAFYLQGVSASSLARDVAVALELDPKPAPNQTKYTWKKICRDAVWVTVSPSNLGLLVDANHDGRLDSSDIEAAKTPHGVVMAAGFGLPGHPGLADRIQAKVDLPPASGTAYLRCDNPRVRVFPTPVGGDAYGAGVEIPFSASGSVFLEFVTDEEASLTLRKPAATGSPEQKSTLKVARLSQGLGNDPLSPMLVVIPGHAAVNLTRGNLLFAVPVRTYATPQDLILNPDVSLSYNHLDGIRTGLGRGFRTNYDLRLYDGSADKNLDSEILLIERQAGDLLALIDETGRRYLFSYDTLANRFMATAGSGMPAAFVDPDRSHFDANGQAGLYYKLVRHDNRFCFFDRQGFLVRVEDLRGHALTVARDGLKTLSVQDNPVDAAVSPRSEDLTRDRFEGSGASLAGGELTTALCGGGMGFWNFVYEGTSSMAFPRPTALTISGNFTHGSSQVTYAPSYDPASGKVVGIRLPIPSLTQAITYLPGADRLAGATRATVAVPYGGTIVYDIDPHLDCWTNRMTSLSAAAGGDSLEETRTLDASKRLIESSTVGSYQENYGYDSLGNLTSHQVLGGVTKTYTFGNLGIEGANRILSTTVPAPGGMTQFYYYCLSGPGFPTQNTALWGLPVEIVDPNGNTESIQYDATGRRQATQDRRDNLWTIVSQDKYGQPLEILSPEGRTLRATYNGLGMRETSTNILGIQTTFHYDERNRAVGQTQPGGSRTSRSFDPLGRVVSSTDLAGHTSVFVHDALGRVVKTIDSGINPLVLDYKVRADGEPGVEVEARRGTNGRLLYRMTQDALGRRAQVAVERILRPDAFPTTATECITEYSYVPGEIWLDQVTDAAGNVTGYTFDEAGRVETIRLPGGGTTQMSYNGAGWLKSQVDPDLVASAWTYWATGEINGATNGAGGTVTSEFDAERNLVAVRRNDGSQVETAEYDNDGLLQTSVDRFGVRSRVSMLLTGDSAAPGSITTEILRPDGAPTGRNVTQILDRRGMVRALESSLGNTSFLKRADGITLQTRADRRGISGIDLDGLDRITKSYSPAGSSTQSFAPTTGDLTGGTNALGLGTSIASDVSGDTSHVLDDQTPQGQKNLAILERDVLGRTLSYRDAEGRLWYQTYSDAARESSTLAPDGVLTTRQFTPGGRLASIRVSGGGVSATTSFHYDSSGFLMREIDPVGQIKSFTYDRFGRLETEKIGAKTTTYARDPLTKEVLTVTSTGRGQLRIGRGLQGRVEFFEQDGQRTSYSYDDDPLSGLGRLVEIRHPDQRTEHFTYYPASMDVAVVRDRAGRQVKNFYDQAGRITQRKFLDTGEVASYGYNSAGQILSESFNGGTVGYSYDTRGRMTAFSQGGGQSVNFVYTNDNLLKQKVYGAQALEYFYRPDGLLGRVVETLNGQTGQAREVSFGYDSLGRVNLIQMPGVSRSLTYDGAGRLLAMSQQAGTQVDGFSYEYGAENRLTRLSGSGWARQFGYDAAGRLLQETRTGSDGYRIDYTYDPRDNRTSKSVWVGGTATFIKEFFDGVQIPSIVDTQGPPAGPARGTWSLQGGKLGVAGTGEGFAGLNLPVGGAAPFTVLLKPDDTVLATAYEEQTTGIVFGKTADGCHLAGVTARREPMAQGSQGPVPITYKLTVLYRPAAGGPDQVVQEELIEEHHGGEIRLNLDLNTSARTILAEVYTVPPSAGEVPELMASLSTETTYEMSGERGLGAWRSAANQPVSAAFDDFGYFVLSGGARQTTLYSNNGMNQLESISGAESGAFHYDAAGNLLDQTLNGVTTTFGYDSLNRLIRTSSPEVQSRTVYSGAGWIRSSVSVEDINGPRNTTYQYDGFSCISSMTQGAPQSYYFVPGRSPLWESTGPGSGGLRVYTQDGLGSISGHFGTAQYLERFRYDAFGSLKTTDAGGAPLPNTSGVRYRGELYDAHTDTVFLRNRTYSPSLGRFTTMDPKGMVDGPNMYNYCQSDPVNKMDPMGTRVLVAKNSMESFGRWYSANISPTLDDSRGQWFYYGFPTGAEGASTYWTMEAHEPQGLAVPTAKLGSRFYEVQYNGGKIDQANLTANDRTFLAMVASDDVFIFENGSFRRGTDADNGTAYARFETAMGNVCFAGGNKVLNGLAWAGEVSDNLMPVFMSLEHATSGIPGYGRLGGLPLLTTQALGTLRGLRVAEGVGEIGNFGRCAYKLLQDNVFIEGTGMGLPNIRLGSRARAARDIRDFRSLLGEGPEAAAMNIRPSAAGEWLESSLHHLTTNKNWLSEVGDGPYTPKFIKLLGRGGLKITDERLLVEVIGHGGPHPAANWYTLKRLEESIVGLEQSADIRKALLGEIKLLRVEAATPGETLNLLLQQR